MLPIITEDQRPTHHHHSINEVVLRRYADAKMKHSMVIRSVNIQCGHRANALARLQVTSYELLGVTLYVLARTRLLNRCQEHVANRRGIPIPLGSSSIYFQSPTPPPTTSSILLPCRGKGGKQVLPINDKKILPVMA